MVPRSGRGNDEEDADEERILGPVWVWVIEWTMDDDDGKERNLQKRRHRISSQGSEAQRKTPSILPKRNRGTEGRTEGRMEGRTGLDETVQSLVPGPLQVALYPHPASLAQRPILILHTHILYFIKTPLSLSLSTITPFCPPSTTSES